MVNEDSTTKCLRKEKERGGWGKIKKTTSKRTFHILLFPQDYKDIHS